MANEPHSAHQSPPASTGSSSSERADERHARDEDVSVSEAEEARPNNEGEMMEETEETAEVRLDLSGSG